MHQGNTTVSRMRQFRTQFCPNNSLFAGIVFGILFPLAVNQAQLNAQDTGRGDKTATGGVTHAFAEPVGARGISMGGAYVAAPQDAAAVYWNPAGLDNLERKSFSLYFGNLLVGQKQFLAYAHPTLSLGTFGIGVIRIGVDDIKNTDTPGNILGTFPSSHTQFMLSYSKSFKFNMSFGMNLKIEQQDFNMVATPNATASGFGVDLGAIYQPEWLPTMMENMNFGFLIQNMFPSSMKHIAETVSAPRNFKLGLSNPFEFGTGGDQLTLAMDFEKGSADPRIHFGTEYNYHDVGMIRLGFDGGKVVYGAGAIVRAAGMNYGIDYSFEGFDVPEQVSGHRISLTVNFGQTKQQILQAQDERRAKEIEARVREQERINKKLDIDQKMAAGKAKFREGDYFSALIQFNEAAFLDPENETIKQWAQRASIQDQKLREARIDSLAEIKQEQQEVLQKQEGIENALEKGIKFFDAGKWSEAINEWERGLELDPNNPELRDRINQTRNQVQKRVSELTNQADNLANAGRYPEAITKLRDALQLGVEDEAQVGRINQKINRWNSRLSFESAYQQGLIEYEKKNWSQAINYFDQALSVDPNNTTVRSKRERANSWLNANEDAWVSDQVRKDWQQARRLNHQGRNAEALEILKKIYKQQPYKRPILVELEKAEEAVNQ